LVITPCLIEEIEIVDELSVSERGGQGFGSTGK
jgi:dUTPase